MPEMIVLDTHIWLWFINANQEQLPAAWQKQIESAARVGISPVSCYEIALAHQRGRIEFTCPVEKWFSQAIESAGIELLPLNDEIALRAVNLSSIHKDPFDRIIMATALEYNAKLMSMDSLFGQYSELQDFLILER